MTIEIDNDILAEETRTFSKHKESLLANSKGKFVLIKGDEVVDTFESEVDAIAQGHKAYGNVPFLVKRIVTIETPANFVNNHIRI